METEIKKISEFHCRNVTIVYTIYRVIAIGTKINCTKPGDIYRF